MKIGANHICKYSGCTLGKEGRPKEYYACDYCDRISSWRSVACCREHYDLYVREELDKKSKNAIINLLPKRLDKTAEEVQEMYSMSIDSVLEKTKETLKDYLKDDMSNLNTVIEQINNDIDNGRR